MGKAGKDRDSILELPKDWIRRPGMRLRQPKEGNDHRGNTKPSMKKLVAMRSMFLAWDSGHQSWDRRKRWKGPVKRQKENEERRLLELKLGIAMPLAEVRDARRKVRVCPHSLLYPTLPSCWTSTMWNSLRLVTQKTWATPRAPWIEWTVKMVCQPSKKRRLSTAGSHSIVDGFIVCVCAHVKAPGPKMHCYYRWVPSPSTLMLFF